MPENSNVNHPYHYNTGKVECIDMMIELFGTCATRQFCLLNAFKYLWRLNFKNQFEQDIEKAHWYLTKYIELGKEDSNDSD